MKGNLATVRKVIMPSLDECQEVYCKFIAQTKETKMTKIYLVVYQPPEVDDYFYHVNEVCQTKELAQSFIDKVDEFSKDSYHIIEKTLEVEYDVM